jgi:hypothetical protein
MRKTILFTALSLLALAPAARAQTGGGYYDESGRYHQYDQRDGYYDSSGVWHPAATQTGTQGGYYDRSGVWHPTTQGGYYDRSGVWHSAGTQGTRGGYYDSNGVWHPTGTQYGTQTGYYDRNGVWHPTEVQSGAEGGYYDRNGVWHPTSGQDGYYDRNGVWHPATQGTQGGYYDSNGVWHPTGTQYGTQTGYYDRNGVWHPSSAGTQDGYYDRNGQWHAYGDGRYDRVTGPDRWTFSDRGRSEALTTAARNFALTAASVDRELRRHSNEASPVALQAFSRLDDEAQDFARVAVRTNRAELVGRAYRQLVVAFADAQQSFGALEPDSWLVNQFHVLASAMGRLDRRYFGDRAFGGRNPGTTGYGYERTGQFDPYGYRVPQGRYDRDGRGIRPQN